MLSEVFLPGLENQEKSFGWSSKCNEAKHLKYK